MKAYTLSSFLDKIANTCVGQRRHSDGFRGDYRFRGRLPDRARIALQDALGNWQATGVWLYPRRGRGAGSAN